MEVTEITQSVNMKLNSSFLTKKIYSKIPNGVNVLLIFIHMLNESDGITTGPHVNFITCMKYFR